MTVWECYLQGWKGYVQFEGRATRGSSPAGSDNIRCCVATDVSTSAFAEIKTITYVIGREVKVDLPAKRVVLGFTSNITCQSAVKKPMTR